MLVRYRNMLMYYKYDEFSMYKAMGFAAKNEENGNSFVYIQHKFARTAQACADAHQRTFALIQHLIHLQRIHTKKNKWVTFDAHRIDRLTKNNNNNNYSQIKRMYEHVSKSNWSSITRVLLFFFWLLCGKIETSSFLHAFCRKHESLENVAIGSTPRSCN